MNRFMTIVGVAILIAGCTGGAVSPSFSSGPSAGADAPIPVVVDTDLGADDILALAILLRDPSVEVRAITLAGTGLVHCTEGMRNLRGLLHQMQASPIPIGCGGQDPGSDGRPFPDEWRAGTDAAYGLDLPPAPPTQSGGAALAILAQALSESDGLTLVVLGPWTNLAELFAAHPDLVARVDRIHAMGGALEAPGNVMADDGSPLEPSMEWNLAADPSAVADVLDLGIPVRFVALDATDRLPVDASLYEQLRADTSAAGANVAFELLTRNQYLLAGGNYLWDELAALTVSDEDLVTWERVGITVDTDPESGGHLERDASGRQVEISTDAATSAAMDAFVTALGRGGPRQDPFAIAGRLDVVWDGQTCTADAPAMGGFHEVVLLNQTDTPAGAAYVSITPPHAWAEAVAFLETYDPAAQAVPDWIVPLSFMESQGTTTASGTADIPAGLTGWVCWTGGTDDAPVFTPGRSVSVGARS